MPRRMPVRRWTSDRSSRTSSAPSSARYAAFAGSRTMRDDGVAPIAEQAHDRAPDEARATGDDDPHQDGPASLGIGEISSSMTIEPPLSRGLRRRRATMDLEIAELGSQLGAMSFRLNASVEAVALLARSQGSAAGSGVGLRVSDRELVARLPKTQERHDLVERPRLDRVGHAVAGRRLGDRRSQLGGVGDGRELQPAATPAASATLMASVRIASRRRCPGRRPRARP